MTESPCTRVDALALFPRAEAWQGAAEPCGIFVLTFQETAALSSQVVVPYQSPSCAEQGLALLCDLVHTRYCRFHDFDRPGGREVSLFVLRSYFYILLGGIPIQRFCPLSKINFLFGSRENFWRKTVQSSRTQHPVCPVVNTLQGCDIFVTISEPR